MAHETTVHRWDAQSAAGTPDPVPTWLACDGVSEMIDIFLAAADNNDVFQDFDLDVVDAGDRFHRRRGGGTG